MTETEWLACADPQKMLEFLRGTASDRKLRLFALACIRPVLYRLRYDGPEAIEIAEKFLEGQATEEAYNEAKSRFPMEERIEGEAVLYRGVPKDAACEALFENGAWDAASHTRHHAANYAWLENFIHHKSDLGFMRGISHDVHTAQASLIRDFFGPLPFRSLPTDPTWLPIPVTQLAQTIYDEKVFDRMPILADALEEAGCTSQDILSHCRQPGDHVRGCWVVDLVLNKK